MTGPVEEAGVSIRALRTLLIAGLVASVSATVFGVGRLTDGIFENFGPAVRQDLEWKALRGARELAKVSDIAFALGDTNLLNEALSDYKHSDDVLAIIADSSESGHLLTYGRSPISRSKLFSTPPDTLHEGDLYIFAWSEVAFEGTVFGRLGLVISKHRLLDSRDLQRKILLIVRSFGCLALILGLVVLVYFAHLIIEKDHRLWEYAHLLEEKVAERTAELDECNWGMRLVLDNVDQGFVTIDYAGNIGPERSAAFERWFPEVRDGKTLVELLHSAGDAKVGEWLDIELDQVRDGFVTPPCLFPQFPHRAHIDHRTFSFEYGWIDRSQHILVVLSDITAEVEAEKVEAEQRETLELVQRITKDKYVFLDFLDDARRIVAKVVDDDSLSLVVQKRLIHTLKGNCLFYGMKTISEACDEIEHRVAVYDNLDAEDKKLLNEAWQNAEERISAMVGDQHRDVIEIDRGEYLQLIASLVGGYSSDKVITALQLWMLDPAQRRLDQLKEQGHLIAQRLGKEGVTILTEGNNVRLESKRWAPFWLAMTHAVRNALDHGLESASDRQALGKSEAGKLLLVAQKDDQKITISVEDDGGGINWARIGQKAEEMGLPHRSTTDLAEALFADGLSTRDFATDISGRGVGMSALRETVTSLGGSIQVATEAGYGTRMTFVFPLDSALGDASQDLTILSSDPAPTEVEGRYRFP